MFLTFPQLRNRLSLVIDNKSVQGHVVGGLKERLAAMPDSYDALWSFANEIASLPLRPGWKFVEPNEWPDILNQLHPSRERSLIRQLPSAEAADRARAAFLGCVAGCILGKPLEIHPTMAELQTAFEKIGDWPLADYISGRVLNHGNLRSLHPDAPETLRENIRWVAPDDDLNYTVLGMLMLEKFGPGFTQSNLREMWGRNIPPFYSFGPERTLVVKSAADSLCEQTENFPLWVNVLNPNDELCGAQIRVDAYGYACPGRPELAAELAWRDSSWTHRRTGVYSAMFMAALIAIAAVETDRFQILERALQYVPQRSRFHMKMREALDDLRTAPDWLQGYSLLHKKLQEYRHCQIYFETATLMNTLLFAQNVGDGICKQVMQGNDTDSYGARAGSLLGAYFGPGHLEDRWLTPFHDRMHTTLANFHEQSLTTIATRMSALPALITPAVS